MKYILFFILTVLSILSYGQTVNLPEKRVSVIQTTDKGDTTNYVVFKLPTFTELKAKAKQLADTTTVIILSNPTVINYIDSMKQVAKDATENKIKEEAKNKLK